MPTRQPSQPAECAPPSVGKGPSRVDVGFSYPAARGVRDATLLPHLVHAHAEKVGLSLVDLPASTPQQQARSIARLASRSDKLSALLVLALAPDDDALAAALEGCRAAGTVIISLRSAPLAGAQVSLLDAAEREAQAAVATHMFERIHGRGKVAYLQDRAWPADAPQRQGLQNALHAFPEIELVSTLADVADDPDVVAIIAASDALALAAVQAVATSGSASKPLIAGFGASPDALLAVQEDQLTATVRLDLDAIASRALNAALDTCDHAPASGAAPRSFEVVTRDNVARATAQALRTGLNIIDDLAQRAREFRDASNFAESVLDSIPLMLFVKDAANLRLLRINKAREEWFGISRADQLGKTARDLYPLELAERFEASDRAVLNQVPDRELPEEHPTKSPRGDRYVQTKKLPILGEDGTPAFLVGISFDITERKLAELALAQRNAELEVAHATLQQQQTKLLIAEKMASLGRLTAGIAHEMNTPLAAVRAAMRELSALVDEYAEAVGDPQISVGDHHEIVAEMKRSIELADKSAARAAGFVRGIKSQTRDLAPHESVIFNAVPVVQESILLLSHALRDANCSPRFQSSAEIFAISGSPGRLSQVVTNLITNAIDASESKGGGEIRIELAPSSDGLVLRVVDQGCGIAPEIMSKIFDPMFTTKPFGQGTGLGLSLLHDIVVGDFGGSVEVTSVPGEGTTFALFFGLAKGKVV